MTINVLALDIEGGHGGSSRSLFNLVQYLDPEQVKIEVWCKRNGAIKDAYAELGVKCRIESEITKVSALPQFSRNVYAHLKFTQEFMNTHKFRARLLQTINKRFDVVHFNHESLAWLGAWLRPKTNAGFVFHNRTMLWDSVFARTQIKVMDQIADRLVFITENERDNIRKLGAKTSGVVIYNPVSLLDKFPEVHQSLRADKKFKVCCLSNYSWNRGIDRLVEVAQILQTHERNVVLFVVAGDMTLSTGLTARLGIKGKGIRDLSDYARLKGVSDMFLFLGHVEDPETVLTGCDILAKPSRESNPWGRDILEAMALGKPVISIGSYDVFVKNDQTGILLKDYNAKEFAQKILDLTISPKKVSQMGLCARQVVTDKCNGTKRAGELTGVWLETASNK
jgi:glycosyltransferase involved in cell wall biosynthesis